MFKTIPKLICILIIFVCIEVLAFVVGLCTSYTQGNVILHVNLFLLIAIIFDMV